MQPQNAPDPATAQHEIDKDGFTQVAKGNAAKFNPIGQSTSTRQTHTINRFDALQQVEPVHVEQLEGGSPQG